MPKNVLVAAGNYKVRKRFRNEEHVRHRKDLPWSKTILDLEKNQFLSRTPLSWLTIIAYYLFLYFLIAMIVIILLGIFHLTTRKENQPTWLKRAPGLSMIPPSFFEISYDTGIPATIFTITEKIDKFIQSIDRAQETFEECNKDKLWGYTESPCVFVKLNNVIGFTAKTYDSTSELPDNHPTILETTMRENAGTNRIWLTCECAKETPVLKFIPAPYFDCKSDLNGVNRVVAVQLQNLPNDESVEFTCKIWAKNIKINDDYSGCGHTKFTISKRFQI